MPLKEKCNCKLQKRKQAGILIPGELFAWGNVSLLGECCHLFQQRQWRMDQFPQPCLHPGQCCGCCSLQGNLTEQWRKQLSVCAKIMQWTRDNTEKWIVLSAQPLEFSPREKPEWVQRRSLSLGQSCLISPLHYHTPIFSSSYFSLPWRKEKVQPKAFLRRSVNMAATTPF